MAILPTGSLPAILALGALGAMLWAVAIEFQFYLVFPFLMRVLNERGYLPLFALMALALLIRYGAVSFGANLRDISYWTSIGRIDQFLIGMMAARLSLQRDGPYGVRRVWLLIVSVMLVIGTLHLFHLHGGWVSNAWWKGMWPTVEGLMWAVFIYAYLPFARTVPQMMSSLLSRIGTISYSTYLLHVPILLIIGTHGLLLRFTGRPAYDLAATILLIAFPMVLCVAALSYYAIEKPFLELRVKYTVAAKD